MISNLYNAGKNIGKKLFLGGLLLYLLGCDTNIYNEGPIEPKKDKKGSVKTQPSQIKKKETKVEGLEQKLFSRLDNKISKRLKKLRESLQDSVYSMVLKDLQNFYDEHSDEDRLFRAYVEDRLNLLSDQLKLIKGKKIEFPSEEDFLKYGKLREDVWGDTTKQHADSVQKALEDSIQALQDTTKRKEKPKKLARYSFDFGLGYDFGKEPYNANANLRLSKNNIIFGVKVGYGEQSTKYPDRVILTSTDPMTGFRGEGVERTKDRSVRNYYGIEVGYNLGPISAVLDAGLEVTNLTMNKQVEEYILNRMNRVVASNKDNYAVNNKTKKLIPGLGFDINLKQVDLGARLNYRNKKLEPEFKIFYNLGK